MKITVILCTFNRSRSLAKVLESLANSTLPKSVEWEVLVVDNNSSDATRQVVDQFCLLYPLHFRYVFEPTPGKSYALNRGIRESQGDVLAFTDDDVTVESTWMQNLTSCLDNGKWAGAGGRILPEHGFSPPDWIPRNRRYGFAPLTVFDPALEAGPLDESPFGANMAFQRRVFETYGGFRTDLGPGLGPGIPQKSEDSEFGTRLLTAKERLRYEPSALVYHSVSPSRLRKSYFLAWWFDKARADIRAFGIPLKTKWAFGGIPLRLFGRLFLWTLRWLATLEPSRRFDCKLKVWVNGGEIIECYRQSRSRGTARSKD